ncbi:MAG: TetR/AcrR family transcriptional regulator [Polyangiaceae bacterium]|nr:TetR/AcrR family transcriptional regulator [Polyangiaceae bacterium]
MRVRGSYKKSEVSRQQVLDAALKTLATQGYAKTSVSDIARTAGMSKGAVHYHFESKDDLIEQVLQHCADTMRDRVRQAWTRPGAPHERVLRALMELRAARKTAGPELKVLADLMAQGLHDPKLQARVQRMLEDNRVQVAQGVAESLESLGIRPKIPSRVIPRLLLGVLDGLALHEFFDPSGEEDELEVTRALSAIVFSLFEVE